MKYCLRLKRGVKYAQLDTLEQFQPIISKFSKLFSSHLLTIVAWLKVCMELIWTTVLLLASPQKKKKSRGLKPSAKQILLIPGNEKCCDCGKLYLCQTSGFSLWDCLFVGLSCAVSRSRCSKNPAPSGKPHDRPTYLFFSKTTLCTHLSGNNLSFLKVFLP